MTLCEEEINLYCITALKFQSLYLLFQHNPDYPDIKRGVNSPRVMKNGCKHHLWNNIFETVNQIIPFPYLYAPPSPGVFFFSYKENKI